MDDVRVVFSKWGGRPHWRYTATRLGEDEHGTWLGLPIGTRLSRPGAAFGIDQLQCTLVPTAAPFVASFYRSGGSAPCDVYVDVTTVPVWDGATVRVVDLDLDVVRGWTGRVWVDDEDEFADHRVRFGYPDDVVRLALASCEQVRHAVESRRPPYDGRVGEHWLDRLDGAIMER